MANSGDWMPSTFGGKKTMFSNVRDKIAGYATELGLSAGEVTAAETLCEEYLAVTLYQEQSAASASGVNEWRDLILTGTPKGSPAPDPPPFSTFTNNAAYVIGILNVFRDMREQWVAAPGYTQAIGEDLMIVKTGEPLDPSGVTPLISVSPAQSGYLAGVTVSERGDSDMWIVETRQNGGNWQSAGSFTGKTADVTITPTTPGQPEVVDFRIRLRKSNENYGNISLTATVTVNP